MLGGKVSDLQVDTSGKDSQWGTGGMVTKLTAARIATAAGCTMVICSSQQPQVIPAIMKGKQAGTVFHPLPNAVRYGFLMWELLFSFVLC